jgi:hypothetical protein
MCSLPDPRRRIQFSPQTTFPPQLLALWWGDEPDPFQPDDSDWDAPDPGRPEAPAPTPEEIDDMARRARDLLAEDTPF